MHECDICEEFFSTRRQRIKHRKQVHARLQCMCRRKFVLDKEMDQHRAAMIENAKAFRCPDCCLSFNTEDGRQHHLRKFKHGCPTDIEGNETKQKRKRNRPKRSRTGEHVCTSCSNRFAKLSSLLQHQKSKGHSMQTDDSRKSYFDNFYERNVNVHKEDMDASRQIVDTTMSMLMSNVREQPGGTIFSPNVIKAGSVPVNSKIGKADEFDTNIELNVAPVDVRRYGKINYGYSDNGDTTNMNLKRDIARLTETRSIPTGFATASVEKGSVPERLLHDKDIVPHEVKQDLFSKLKTAKDELSLTHVDLSSKAHGPALTMTIHPQKETGVKHDISVDVTPSLKTNVSITDHGWPRPETKKAFHKDLIDKVIQTGTHLVPKKDELWSVSNSKAERTLMSSIDEGNGCRKKVYKIMKKYVQTSKSQSTDGLPEISSHILKTQVLWSSEKHPSKDYWHEDNRDVCLVDTVKELEVHFIKAIFQIILIQN